MARSGAPSVLPQLRRLLRHRVEQALLLLEPRRALLGRAGLAEHPLEGHARVDADRQRAGVVAPGERVEEGAGEAVAGAGRGAHVLGADLDRAQRRVAGDLVGDVLVERLLRLDLAERVAGRLARRRPGPTPLRNAELAPTCTDSPHGAFILLIVTS